MKEIQILGLSADSIAIIYDMLHELKGTINLNVFMNKNFSIKPNCPVKYISINKIETLPLDKEPVFFGVASPMNKSSIFEHFREKANINTSNYINLIHSSSYIAPSVIFEEGILVEPQVVISSQSSIEFGVFVKRGSLVGHHNHIGAFTDINPGVVLSGKVNVGRCCIIGSGTVIKDNINIGDNTIIGVGSVVTKDIPSGVIAYGNPCRPVRKNKLIPSPF